ncbi:M48 family metallopeptidase [Streptomyces hainanensis]|nr:M48 family metalloprotease [Streptomyces hainanensis]
MAAPGSPAEAARSRTFLLPSATLSAFVLLIVAVLAFSVVMQPSYYHVFTGGSGDATGDPVDGCVRQGVARAGGPRATMELWARGERLPGVAECARTAFDPAHSQSFLITCGLLAVFTGLHYRFRSTRRARRRGVRPVTQENLPDLHTDLLRLAALAVPGQPVRFLIDLLDPAANGVAFGRVGRRYVLLGRGVLRLRDRDPEAFEALVLHELAHVRNRDIDLTMITLGFFRAYALLVFTPVALGRVAYAAFGPHSGIYAASSAQLLGLALLLVVARAQVLRTREYQADARVVRWQGDPAPLGRLLAEVARRPHGRAGRLRAWGRRLTGTHPGGPNRAAALTDPAPLLAPAFGFAVVLGACLMLLWEPSSSPTARWSYGSVWDQWRPEPLTVLLMVVLGLTVLRAALRWERPRLHALRWGLAVGVVVGMALSPMTIANGLTMPTSFGVETGNVLLRAALLVSLVLWCEYLAAAWAPAVVAARRPLVVALLPCAMVVAVVLVVARPVLELHAIFILSQYDGSATSELPGPLLVFAVTETTALASYFDDVWWLLGAALLLFGPPALGRLGRPGGRRAAPVAPAPVAPVPSRAVPARRRAGWFAGALAYLGLWWVLAGYLDVRWGVSLSPLSDGMLVAGVPAATATVVAVFAPHPVRWAVVTSVSVGLCCGVLFVLLWGMPAFVMRQFVVFGVQGAVLAAFVVSAVTAPRRRRRARRPAGPAAADVSARAT